MSGGKSRHCERSEAICVPICIMLTAYKVDCFIALFSHPTKSFFTAIRNDEARTNYCSL